LSVISVSYTLKYISLTDYGINMSVGGIVITDPPVDILE
jgi:hypothetical protein